MFLRSLSMRGFKSFADRQVLEVEPGITVIVGPNGSGKSNVVDALAWVLGTHSAKKVRGGSMLDVIFAGSPTRKPAGRAQVEIVIDNSAGQLTPSGLGTAHSAAQFSEVRVTRTIHRDGETSYQINGEEVRALDVQELLSDTGLGRELHTIVGQGQLDEILNAKPEERRRYIEEAAGILKHRRRRERALRKLEQVDGHVDKLRTVLRELRRQLRPLERQAEAADRHAALQAELREVATKLAALQLYGLTEQVEAQGRQGDRTASELADLERRRAASQDRVDRCESELAQLGPRVDRAQSAVYELTSLAERLRGTSDLIEAKRRHLVEYVEEPLAGRPPAELQAQADRIAQQREERAGELDADRLRLQSRQTERREAEQARRVHQQQRQVERRRRAQQRERVLRWEGEVSALRGAIASAEAELGRVTATLDGLDGRTQQAEQDVASVQEEIRRLDVSEVELTSRLEEAEADVAAWDTTVEELAARARELEAARTSQAARAEALRAALAETDGGTSALLTSELEGVLGPVAEHVRIAGGHDEAVAAALGRLGEAVIVSNPERARRAIAWLREVDGGRAIVLAARHPVRPAPEPGDATKRRLATAGAEPIADLLEPAHDKTERGVVSALKGLLATAYLVEDWDTAVLLHGRDPELTFVTPAGDVAGPAGYVAGGSLESSAVVTATAADKAEREAEQLATQLEHVTAERNEAERALNDAKQVLASATERINESDAQITGAAERLARLNKELHSLTTQREVVTAQKAELQGVLDRDRTALSELHGRGPQEDSEAADEEEGPDPVADELDEAVEAARDRELDARVTLERITEQVRHLQLQEQQLRDEAEAVASALEEAARRREARRVGIERCGELGLVARAAIDALERTIEHAAEQRDQLQQHHAQRRDDLAEARKQLAQVRTEADELRERRHTADLQRAELQTRLDNLTTRIRNELSLSPEEVRAEHPDAAHYDQDELTEREDALVRKIGLLGRVNPLALEEFKALEERHAFLSDQLDDLRRSKRDLEQIVVAVDERIREVFKAAFDDVAQEFELTFSTVFPGGHGRLVLTGEDDLLTAGVEVEARPPGKKVTRLSLLSGGERSLTVLAFVFAIFRARPSPFYVLDEVDAALDDVNLQRLLRVVRSFRGTAQIIMVTHQKRSMEIADVLYGVTMGPDAVTKVVAERLRDEERATGTAAQRVEALEERTSDAPTEALTEVPTT